MGVAMRALLVTLLVATATFPRNGTSQAQSGRPLVPYANLPAGATVRVWSDKPSLERQQASVVVAAQDSLRVAVDRNDGTTPAVISYNDLRRLELRGAPSRGRGALRGFGFGLLTAIAFDAALVAYAGTKNDGDTDMTAGFIGAVATPILVIGGTVIGAGHPMNSWTLIYQR